jgi:hypothetical protein
MSRAFDKIREALEDARAYHSKSLMPVTRVVELALPAESGARRRALHSAVDGCRESRKKRD